MPVYQLLGGAARDRIRVYAHWGIRDLTDEALARARERLDMLAEEGRLQRLQGRPGRQVAGARAAGA